MTPQTPLPWHVRLNPVWPAIRNAQGLDVAEHVRHPADAEFIVLAANHHEALVRLAERLADPDADLAALRDEAISLLAVLHVEVAVLHVEATQP